MSTDTLIKPDTTDSDTDDDVVAHIVLGKGRLTQAMVEGTPIEALCGKWWVPSRDPKGRPICGECKRIAEAHGITVPSS